MRIILITLVSLFTWSLQVDAQNEPDQRPGLEIDELRLKKGSNSIPLAENVETLVSKLGNPDSREYYYAEMHEKDGELIKYSNNDIYIMEGTFESFVLRDHSLKIGFNGNFVKVGDNISSIESFYTSYQNYLEYSDTFSSHYISIPFQRDGILWDMQLIISYDSNGIITEIMKYNPG